MFMFRAKSADVKQDPSHGLNIQMTFFGVPHSWPTFTDSFMNN